MPKSPDLGGRQGVRDRVRQEATASGFALAAALGREIEEALSKPA